MSNDPFNRRPPNIRRHSIDKLLDIALSNRPPETMLEGHPDITHDDLEAALAFAAGEPEGSHYNLAFQRSFRYVMGKNAELYRRLAEND